MPFPPIFDEMPDLQVQLLKGRAGAAGPSGEPEGMDYLDGDARNMAMVLWAIKRHKGEQRMLWDVEEGSLAAQAR